ncbi:50S ribosomal protein L16 [Candidatus Nomurabacteria bacterium]|uniref:Large ribosomal subunit protein uL16 n=1 Tax=Candidatus Dojkabacteria bacterium TaxID=2099670 RepID=A0A955I4W0_9BACT|nr:50S ribosomal protein L16 [Candidatus Dojkabacteria bacterium]MCB9789414.1 50S ribosomal protein L16 [Candidatus Nomurabacteria bacterium]MCB9803736.1 50S ribosomal protein L16 [Candidatus Nomurabacteria bacterium]
MLQPKKTKFRKEFRGKMGGVAMANNNVDFGDYGLKATGRGWINSREIESARRAIVGYIKRKGKVWIKIFPQKSYTAKPTNAKMEAGKGDVQGYVAVVRPGTVMFEIGGVTETIAKEAFRLASHKLSIKTKMVTRTEL